MALEIQIKEDMARVDRHLFKTETQSIRKAGTAAINKVLMKVRTTANQTIRQNWKVKASDINKTFRLKRATWGNMTARITAPTWAPNLARYRPKQTKEGVKANVRGKQKLYRGAFIMPNGRTVMTRRTKKRLPIEAVHGPNLPYEFRRKAVKQAMDRRGSKEWPIEFANQLQRLL